MAKTQSPGEEYCGTTYAAKLLRLSVASVQGLVESGQLEAWKTRGGHRRISMRSLAKYMDGHGLHRPAEGATTERLRVLVVDDDPIMREVYQPRLQALELPLDFTVMGSALEALMDIANLDPDILVTDLNMPGINGFDMVRMLDAAPKHAEMAIVVVTGLSAEDVERRGGLPPRVICRFKPLDMAWMEGFLNGFLRGRLRTRRVASAVEPALTAGAELP